MDVMQQARAMCQGLLLGGGLGVLYDLLRVVRVRGKLRWLGARRTLSSGWRRCGPCSAGPCRRGARCASMGRYSV